ncbi:hypothetical protein [Solicola sp. PLA-1-18]|uniref:hypothetical protein n=1 Tax=Solicola sp. PLA-1-18 TaxID=3380532 RepID=UPI003B821443
MTGLGYFYCLMALFRAYRLRQHGADAVAGRLEDQADDQLTVIRMRVSDPAQAWLARAGTGLCLALSVFLGLADDYVNAAGWAVLAGCWEFSERTRRRVRPDVLKALRDRGGLPEPLRRDTSATRTRVTQRYATLTAVLFASATVLAVMASHFGSVVLGAVAVVVGGLTLAALAAAGWSSVWIYGDEEAPD